MKKKTSVLDKPGFTLLEVIIAVTSFFLLLTVIINIYTKMMHLKYNIQARTNIIQNSHDTIEKMNLLLKNYTIDYEEYFNRKNVGCNKYQDNFIRDVGITGHCENFTAYGNNTTINGIQHNENRLYFCSSNTSADEYIPQRVIKDTDVENGSGCINTGQQSFGEYYRQFRDVKDDTDSVPGSWNDDDDENVMKGPNAIEDPSQVKELYLISQDGRARVVIRRALIESGDRNNTGGIDSDNEKRYTLQILKLKGFDAGDNHNFDVNTSSGVYDGKIDTRACDYAQGFICNGSGIGGIYTGYTLPSDQNDGWVNLFQKNITISDRNIIVYPTKNPQYALAENDVQINPYFTINFTSKLYGEIWQKKLGMQSIDNFQINIQTTFNTKNFYTK